MLGLMVRTYISAAALYLRGCLQFRLPTLPGFPVDHGDAALTVSKHPYVARHGGHQAVDGRRICQWDAFCARGHRRVDYPGGVVAIAQANRKTFYEKIRPGRATVRR